MSLCEVTRTRNGRFPVRCGMPGVVFAVSRVTCGVSRVNVCLGGGGFPRWRKGEACVRLRCVRGCRVTMRDWRDDRIDLKGEAYPSSPVGRLAMKQPTNPYLELQTTSTPLPAHTRSPHIPAESTPTFSSPSSGKSKTPNAPLAPLANRSVPATSRFRTFFSFFLGLGTVRFSIRLNPDGPEDGREPFFGEMSPAAEEGESSSPARAFPPKETRGVRRLTLLDDLDDSRIVGNPSSSSSSSLRDPSSGDIPPTTVPRWEKGR